MAGAVLRRPGRDHPQGRRPAGRALAASASTRPPCWASPRPRSRPRSTPRASSSTSGASTCTSPGRSSPSSRSPTRPGVWNRTDHRPLEGFVYAITPFNFTAIAGNLPTAPALMGNTVLWKPSPTQQLAAHLTMELLEEAGLPPGVINMLPGDGLTSPRWRWRTPTWPASTSPAPPRRSSTCGARWGRTSPATAPTRASSGRPAARTSSSPTPRPTWTCCGSRWSAAPSSSRARSAPPPRGPTCRAAVWDRLKDDLVAETENITMGDVTDLSNFMGAVIDDRAFAKHEKAIARAQAARRSSTVLAGGKIDDSVGWFVRPTLVEAERPHRRRCSATEYFGPILAVHVYEDGGFETVVDQMESFAPYALTGAVIAQDRRAIAWASERLRFAAGNFYVNDKPTGAVVGQQPFGGGAGLGHQRQGRRPGEPAALDLAAQHQGDVRAADRLPLPVHGLTGGSRPAPPRAAAPGASRLLTVLLAFGPFVVLGGDVWLSRRRDAREDGEQVPDRPGQRARERPGPGPGSCPGELVAPDLVLGAQRLVSMSAIRPSSLPPTSGMLTLTSRLTVSVVPSGSSASRAVPLISPGLPGIATRMSPLCRGRPVLGLHDVDLVADDLLGEARDALGRLHLVDVTPMPVALAVDGDGAAQHPLVVADLLAERGVGQHLVHLLQGRAVVAQLLADLLHLTISSQPGLAGLAARCPCPGRDQPADRAPRAFPRCSGTLTFTLALEPAVWVVRPPASQDERRPPMSVGRPGASSTENVAPPRRGPLLDLHQRGRLAGELPREARAPRAVGWTWSMRHARDPRRAVSARRSTPRRADTPWAAAEPSRKAASVSIAYTSAAGRRRWWRGAAARAHHVSHDAPETRALESRADPGADPGGARRLRRGAVAEGSAPAAHLRQLPAAGPAARRPAPGVRPAGARRAAVHHHPPGLRAVVPAAAARARSARARRHARGGDRSGGPRHLLRPRARDRAGAGRTRSTCWRR